MVEVGRHHHPVPGGRRQLRALHTRHSLLASPALGVAVTRLGRDALRHQAPGPVVADRAGVGVQLELETPVHNDVRSREDALPERDT